MKTIWKFDLTKFSLGEICEIQMPSKAKILWAESDNKSGDICVWAFCDPEREIESRKFIIYYTGMKVNATDLIHISSFQDHHLVYHVFEVNLPR